MTNQIIPIVKGIIGQSQVNTVNGRELHEFLEVETRFNDWIVRRIEEYGFIDGQDYVRIDSSNLSNQTGRGGDRRSIDYHLSLDMGKELSMVEKTAKGREARRYFIECERRALEGEPKQPNGELPRWKDSRLSMPKRISMFLDANPGDHHNAAIDEALGLTTSLEKRARTKAMSRLSKDGFVAPGLWPKEWIASSCRLSEGGHIPRNVSRNAGRCVTDSDIAVRFGQFAAAKDSFMDAGCDLFGSIQRKARGSRYDYTNPDRSSTVHAVNATEAAFYALDRVMDCIESLTRSIESRA